MVSPLPQILVNFKTYQSALGDHALALAKALESAALASQITVALAVNPLDIARVAAGTRLPLYSQHTDIAHYGSHTGAIVPAHVRNLGAVGTLLSHSEKRIHAQHIAQHIAAAHTAGLQIIVCAESLAEVAALAAYSPDAIALEPPELIGGDISVVSANPTLISRAVTAAGGIPLMVGAGIRTAADVTAARRLGAHGILLASGIVCADDPGAVLSQLIQAF